MPSERINVVSFTRKEIEFFLKECNFTEQEEMLFKLRTKDYTLEQVAEKMNVCTKTAGRINKRVKNKIIKVLNC